MSIKIPQMPKAAMDMADLFSIERNGQIITEARGFFCGKNYPSTIQLLENADV